MNGLELDAESALTTFRESIMSCYDTDAPSRNRTRSAGKK